MTHEVHPRERQDEAEPSCLVVQFLIATPGTIYAAAAVDKYTITFLELISVSS